MTGFELVIGSIVARSENPNPDDVRIMIEYLQQIHSDMISVPGDLRCCDARQQESPSMTYRG